MMNEIYLARDIVSREQIGMIPSVTIDSSLESAAVDQTIRVSYAPSVSTANITPGMETDNNGGQTFTTDTMTISKMKKTEILWSGNEMNQVKDSYGYNRLVVDQIAQGMRALSNEIEADLCALHTKFSRAYGTAGTTPFASDFSDTAQLQKILIDNGAQTTDLNLVINSTAAAKLLSQTQLTKVNEAGSADFRSQGILLPLHSMNLRRSGQIVTSTAGTGASATTNTAGYAIGATTITLASAGTGTIVAGDVITFANDTNKYVVLTGDTDVSNGGSIVLAAPGLRQALPASAVAITVTAASARNMAFARSAIVLAMRTPPVPKNEKATDDTFVVDPVSGLTFRVAYYAGYMQEKIEIQAAWGVKVFKPEHTALLLG